jgi:hypothetical protein
MMIPSSEISKRRRRNLITALFAVIILVPSMLGFAAKFVEFARTFQGEPDGAFAITPMVNYLLASLGFLCMLIWATFNGMFHDMESPKNVMLQRELMLDEAEFGPSPQPETWPFERRL